MGLQRIETFLKASFKTKEFYSRDRQTLKKMLKAEKLSQHELNVLRSKLFQLVKDGVESVEEVKTVQWIESVNKCLLPKIEDKKVSENRCYFSPGDDCENAIVGCIRNATNSIKICVFTVSENVISEEIIAAHKRGVKVRIITDDEAMQGKGADA